MRTSNLNWRNVDEWVDVAIALEWRRSSSATHEHIAAHWRALPVGWPRLASKREAERLLELMDRPSTRLNKGPWARPARGFRAGKWADVFVEIKNRLANLEREEDRASIGLGHNSREQLVA